MTRQATTMPAASFEPLSGALGCRSAAVWLQCAAMGDFLPAVDSHSTLKRVAAEVGA